MLKELNQNSPFFSIVVPTYNRAHLLLKTIDSIIKQSFEDWELVIVDDGSTDNTKELVQSYNDNRIKYIWQENQERSAARNNGISNSKGLYICFLDSDDYFLEDRLDVLYKEIKERNYPKAFFYTGICFENNGVIVKRTETPNIYNSILDYLVYGVIGNPQACIHHQILEQYKYDTKFSISEDMELWVRIINAGFPLIYLDYANVIATNHNERSVHISSNNHYAQMIVLYKYIFKKSHPGNKVSKSMKHFVLSNAFYGQARYFIYKNEKFLAMKSLSYSLFLFPQSEQSRHKLFLLSKLLFVRTEKCKNLIQFIG
jgi:glycosyltransferase involved in cell wall biosynthesis